MYFKQKCNDPEWPTTNYNHHVSHVENMILSNIDDPISYRQQESDCDKRLSTVIQHTNSQTSPASHEPDPRKCSSWR